jgi:type VI protein secretion system component VasK
LDGESKALLKQLSENRKFINLLKPKRQVIRLFGVLLLALILIGFYYFQHSHFWPYKYEWIRITTILASVALYSYSVLVLWQVFCIIISAKLKEEEENKQKGTTTLQTEKKINHE